jgi:hypothetical protein
MRLQWLGEWGMVYFEWPQRVLGYVLLALYGLFYLVVLLDRAAIIGAEESERMALDDELAYLDQLAEPSTEDAASPILV